MLPNWKNFTLHGNPTSKVFTYFEMLTVAEKSFRENFPGLIYRKGDSPDKFFEGKFPSS